MNIRILLPALMSASLMASVQVEAGPLDPECTAVKAAKSATMKATVGVGGRCDAKEATMDTAGIDYKKYKKNKKDKDKDEGLLGNTTKKALTN